MGCYCNKAPWPRTLFVPCSAVMKVLLAYPYFQNNRTDAENVAAMPIGIYYLAAALIEAGHDVTVANWHRLRDQPALMESELRELAPDVLGVSVFTSNRWGAIDAARAAHKVLPNVRVVFGGIGATFLSRFFLEHFTDVDFVLRGEGERAFPALLKAFEHIGLPCDTTSEEQSAYLSKVPNLSWRSAAGIMDNESDPLVEELDSLPDPAQYFTFQHVILSRGCPGKCSFCGSPRFWGPKVRFHSPAYLIRQIERLASRGVHFFFVSDDTFTLRRENVLEFCHLLVKKNLGITWQAISRVDRVDEEVLEAMRRAGCVQISYGVESGSPVIRATLRKKTTNDQICRAFALTMRYGMLARAYIIYGNPGESDATIAESAELLKKIRPLVTLFHVLTVLPGTALYDQAKECFGLSDEIWMSKDEDVLWFDLDPKLEFEQVHSWGKCLKENYRVALPQYVDSLEVADIPELDLAFADFFARLGMTFDQGDYATLYDSAIREPLAERLYRRSMKHGPDPKAYLGLGMLLYRLQRTEEAVEILSYGVENHQDEPNLRLCLGIGLMSLRRYREALVHLEIVEHYPQAAQYLAECRHILDAQDFNK